METKQGYKTTEFWVTIATQLLGLLAAFGFFTPEQTTALNEGIVELGGVVAMVAAQFGYTLSRGTAKRGIKPGEE